MRRAWAAVVRAAILVMIVGQLAALIRYSWSPLGLSIETMRRPELEKLAGWPPYGATEYLRSQTPPAALVFSLKPADMYYARREMVSYLDPRVLPFYVVKDPIKGASYLAQLGIRYVYAPDYFLPPLYNSTLLEILGRPELSKLRHSSDGYQVFELLASKDKVCGASVSLEPRVVPWEQEHQYTLVGWKPLYRWTTDLRRLEPGDTSRTNSGLPLFSREIATVIRSARVHLPHSQACSAGDAKGAPREYQLQFALQGLGLAQVRLYQFDRNASQLATNLVGEAVLSREIPERKIVRRFWALDETAEVQLRVEHRGASSIRVTQASVRQVARGPGRHDR